MRAMKCRFTFADFVKSFGLSIGLFLFFTAIFSFFPGSSRLLEGLHPTLSFAVQYLIQFMVLFFPLWFFVVDKYGASFKDFGFKKVSWRKLLGMIVLAYISYIILTLAILTLISFLQVSVPGYAAQESYIPFFGDDLLGFAVAFLFISVIAPFLEEIFFRGFVYRIFVKQWPVWKRKKRGKFISKFQKQ